MTGVRVNDVVDIVVGLFKEELKHRWPEEFATLMVSFKPIGALARVGYVFVESAWQSCNLVAVVDAALIWPAWLCSGALADVPRTAIAEYRRSGDIKYAAYQLPTSTGQLIKTAVRCGPASCIVYRLFACQCVLLRSVSTHTDDLIC